MSLPPTSSTTSTSSAQHQDQQQQQQQQQQQGNIDRNLLGATGTSTEYSLASTTATTTVNTIPSPAVNETGVEIPIVIEQTNLNADVDTNANVNVNVNDVVGGSSNNDRNINSNDHDHDHDNAVPLQLQVQQQDDTSTGIDDNHQHQNQHQHAQYLSEGLPTSGVKTETHMPIPPVDAIIDNNFSNLNNTITTTTTTNNNNSNSNSSKHNPNNINSSNSHSNSNSSSNHNNINNYNNINNNILDIRLQPCAILLNRRGGINFIPEEKLQQATWDDVGVNPEKGEATTLYGLDLQAIKVQKLKRLMGFLHIKGRKKFQNSKYDMLRCIYDHWNQKKSGRGTGGVGGGTNSGTNGDAADLGGVNGGDNNGQADNGIQYNPSNSHNIPASLTKININGTASTTNDGPPSTPNQQNPKGNGYKMIAEEGQNITTNNILGTNSSTSAAVVSASALTTPSAATAVHNYQFHAPSNEQQLRIVSTMGIDGSAGIGAGTESGTSTSATPFITTLALAGLNSSNASSLTNQERNELVRKVNDRIDKETERAEKKLKLDEAKLKIETMRERREQEQYKNNMLETYTLKITELRKKKNERSFGTGDEEEEREVLDLLKYYVIARKKLMNDSLDEYNNAEKSYEDEVYET